MAVEIIGSVVVSVVKDSGIVGYAWDSWWAGVPRSPHSGRLPCIDYWVLVLVTRVLPKFFDAWLERRHQLAYYDLMCHSPSVLLNSSLEEIAAADKVAERPPKLFKTVQEADAAAKVLEEEHKMALADFAMSMIELDKEPDEDDDAQDMVIAEGVPFLGRLDIDSKLEDPEPDTAAPVQDVVDELSLSQLVEPSTTPWPAQKVLPVNNDTSPGYSGTQFRNDSMQTDSDASFGADGDPGNVALDSLDIIDSLAFLKELKLNSPSPAAASPLSGLHASPSPAAAATTMTLPVLSPHSNMKASDMMEIQCAEDVWLQAIRTGLNAGLTQADLADMLSLSILQS
ncbi:hypothetical protein DFP72DRAFT_858410 [Ephemerocybe angulata]|uniref:Uncharacterized protein n=1 Tax=Ephemerocybe angulata TaxID=980116 RepID=A0A8H6HB22_9AGAR|nr:hypothetical protein DFP72DRAFT_858410 [Tulosesus angulatus]